MTTGAKLSEFAREGSGNVLAMFAIAITVLLGAAGLGTEAASWYASKRDMQNAADLGAANGIRDLATSYASATTTTDSFAQSEARGAAGAHGYSSGVSNTTVTVNVPPLGGGYTGASYNHRAIEVIVQRPAPLLFSGLFLTSGPTVGARAVALLISGGNCLWVTNSSIPQALQLDGHSTIKLGCDAAVSSTANAGGQKDRAFYVQGSASFAAPTITLAGGTKSIGTTGGKAGVDGTLVTGTTSDPYNYTVPTTVSTACGVCNDITTTTTINADNGSYWIKGNITPATDQTITLKNGIFYIDGGSITLGAHTTLNTENATIVLTNSANLTTCSANCSGIGTFTMQSSNANLNLQAVIDSSYATHGLALVQDPRAVTATLDSSSNNCSTNCSTIYGGPQATITGAVYMKQGNLSYQGSPVTGPGCTQLITNSLILGGNPSIYVDGCSGTGTVLFGPTLVKMVE